MTTEEQKRQENLQRIKEFRLLDDTFMVAVFDRNVGTTELLLRVILIPCRQGG